MKHLIALIAILVAIAVASVVMQPAKANVPWRTDYEQARNDAVRDDQFVLLNFTGSDWCQPCMMLDREIFSEEWFAQFVEGRAALVKLDFPRHKEQSDAERERNEALAREYQIEGFPSIIILDPEGDEVARQTGFQPGAADDYRDWLQGAMSR